MYEINRWSSLNLGRGFTTKNRVVVPPMASSTAQTSGHATPATVEHYERLAQSGAGIIIAEYTFIHKSGRSEEFQLGASEYGHVSGLSKIAQVLKDSGAIAGLQLVHGGGKTTREWTGGELQAPSPIPVPSNNGTFETPDSMSESHIAQWIKYFSLAADIAVEAGFDLIEIHAAHGYGFNQWLSPITNQRTDRFGGSLENRARILRDVIRDIRQRHPQILLSTRIPGQDFYENGLSSSDMKRYSQMLIEDGVDIISVSSGLGGWRRPRDRTSEGYLVDEATSIQSSISKPVIGVGGIETGTYIDRILTQKKISLAAVGRAILANPERWHQSQLGGTP